MVLERSGDFPLNETSLEFRQASSFFSRVYASYGYSLNSPIYGVAVDSS